MTTTHVTESHDHIQPMKIQNIEYIRVTGNSWRQLFAKKKGDRYTKVKEQITVKLPSLPCLNSGCASPLDIDHLHLTVNTETSQFPASLQMTKTKTFFAVFVSQETKTFRLT